MSLVVAFLAGVIYPLGFAPYSIWPLTFFSLFVVFGALYLSRGRALLTLACFAIGKNLVGVSWVYHSIHVFGNAEPFLAGLIVCVFVLILSAFYLPAGLVINFVSKQRKLSPHSYLLLFAACMAFTEWLLTWLMSGFPWLFAGHSVLDMPLSNLLPLLGTLCVSLIIFYLCGAFYLFIKTRRWSYLVPAILSWAVSGFLYPIEWVEETHEYRVALVQANIEQNKKWLYEERNQNLNKHLSLSQDHWDADLLIWPEAAITLFGSEAEEALSLLDTMALESQTSFISGMPTVDSPRGRPPLTRNSVVALGDGSGTYSKVHLVPFGEFVPFENVLRGLIDFFDLPMSSMSGGQPNQENLRIDFRGESISVAPAICYEIAYADTIRERSIGSSLIVTVSNDTWFGETFGPWQHLQIARVRALENGKPMLRVTNNGVTAVIDNSGDIIASLPQFESSVLMSSIKLTTGRTPYSYLADWPVLIAIFGFFLWVYRAPNS